MNGRLTGDLDGKLTSYQRTEAGTVDYGIASEELLKSILGFQVQTLTSYSDHCPISVKRPFSKSGSMNDKSNEEPVRQTKKTPTVQNTPSCLSLILVKVSEIFQSIKKVEFLIT